MADATPAEQAADAMTARLGEMIDGWSVPDGRRYVDRALAAPMGDDRTVAQHLDDGAVAERLVRLMNRNANFLNGPSGPKVWNDGSSAVYGNGVWLPLADVDPAAAALLDRLAR